jgi:hypothetical protein
MAIEPRVFEMRVSEARVLEERSRDAGDELCRVEAGEGKFAVDVILANVTRSWLSCMSLFHLTTVLLSPKRNPPQ